MSAFDLLIGLAGLVLLGLLGTLAVGAWWAIDRGYHWRRTLDRVERTEWDRVLAALRAPQQVE